MEERKEILHSVVDYCIKSLQKSGELHLNFVCTHNSRRSQFSQFWAEVMAEKHGITLSAYSSGVEVTACNERTIASLERSGFRAEKSAGSNPVYSLKTPKGKTISLFSKTYDDPSCPKENFAAIMTCSHADENCPIIPGTSARIPLRYEDPKAFDDTDLEEKMYDERSNQIASELDDIFEQVSMQMS